MSRMAFSLSVSGPFCYEFGKTLISFDRYLLRLLYKIEMGWGQLISFYHTSVSPFTNMV